MTAYYLLALAEKDATQVQRWDDKHIRLCPAPYTEGVPVSVMAYRPPEAPAAEQKLTPSDFMSHGATYTEAQVTERMRELDKLHAQAITKLEADHRQELSEVRHEVELEFEKRKRALRKDNAAASRTALLAKISEHIAPLLKGFPYNYKEVRHVGELFDFLVLDGLESGYIKQVVFLEVKTRKGVVRVTNPREQMLRDAIDNGRVAYRVFVPDTNDTGDDKPARSKRKRATT